MQRARALSRLVALLACSFAGSLVGVGACSLVVDTEKLRNGTSTGTDSGSPVDTGTSTDGGVDTAPADTFSGAPVIGKVYVISGNVEGKQSKEALVADVRDDGTLSAWSNGPVLPAAATTNGTTIIGDTVYVVGVDSNGDTTKTVRFAKLDKGVLGDWALDGSFPRVSRGKLGVAGIPGFVFGIGGSDTDRVGLAEVLFAPLATDGTPGAWTVTTPLPAPRHNFACAQWNDHVWVIGGGDATDTAHPTVFHAKLASSGVAAWDTLGDLSFSPYGSDAVVAGDHLYLLGGYGGAEPQKVWYTPIAADGAIGAWIESSKPMVFGHAEFKALAIGTKLLCAFGGADKTLASTANAECAPLSSSGAPGDWHAVTPLPKPRDFHTGFSVAL